MISEHEFNSLKFGELIILEKPNYPVLPSFDPYFGIPVKIIDIWFNIGKVRVESMDGTYVGFWERKYIKEICSRIKSIGVEEFI